MTINRGINGVSDKDPMRDVEGSHPTHRASRLRRGPVPRRRAFGSGETVARFGVRETIELVRRFFNISGLCHNPILDSPSRPRGARRAGRAAGAPRARRGVSRVSSCLFGYAERSAVRLGLYAIPTGREGEQRSWIKPVLSSLRRPSVSGRRRSDGRACPPLCRAAHLCRTPNTRVDAAQTHAAARRNTVIPTHS